MLTLLALVGVRARPLDAQGQGTAGEFNDSHFHLTNYIQRGIDVSKFLEIMGTRVPRATLFGIALQQVFDWWAPVWKRLTAEASRRIRTGNYERIFDEGRRRVRAWEAANVK